MADKTLSSLTAATPATGGLIYGTQSGADRKFTLSAAGAAVAEATTAADQRTALGLGDLATQGGIASGSTATIGAGAGDILTSDGSVVQKITPGTGVGEWIASPSLANLNSALGESVAPVASPTFTGSATAPAITVSSGQITSTQAASSSTASLDFYANTGATGWPANNDKWFTWSAEINGTKVEIMKLYALDATSWYLSGSFALQPLTIRPSVAGGNLEFVGGTLKFGQAGAPFTDIGKSDSYQPLIIAPDFFQTRFGNSTDAQKILVTNTFTNSTTGEWGVIDWQTTANTLRMGSDVGGDGGTARDVELIRGGTVKLTLGANTTDHAQPAKLPSYTVSGLPDAATCSAGAMAFATDATSTTAYTTATGGGSCKVLVISDGANWIIH